MTTFTWNIVGINTRSDNVNADVIITVWFKITGFDGSYTACYENGVGLNTVKDTFVPLGELTEQQLITWCKNILGSDYCRLLEQTVQNKINLLKNNTNTNLPWKQ